MKSSSFFSSLFLLCCSLLALVCFTGVNAQVVGPDPNNGEYFFFFGNYTCVFILQANYKPSIEFHPVLGGSDNTYIRYENWATFNFTSMQEVDPNNNDAIIAQQDPMALNWTISHSSDVNSTDGNIHYIATISADVPNGAHVEVICESWSLGIVKEYGPYLNNISADQTEISLSVSDWPFQDPSHEFWVSMLIGIDGFGIPQVSSPNSYQRTASLSSATTSFSFTLMTSGLLDGTNTHFEYKATPSSDLAGGTFVLKAPSFNDTYFYDPNFSVLLKNNPDCSKLSNCGHGTCIEDNVCQCKQHYVQPDCVHYNATATSSDENPPDLQDTGSHKKSHSVSTVVIIVVSVGAVLLVVGVMVAIFTMHHNRTRGKTRKLEEMLEKEQQQQEKHDEI